VTDRTYTPCFPDDMRMNESNDPVSTARFARRFFSRVHRNTDLDEE